MVDTSKLLYLFFGFFIVSSIIIIIGTTVNKVSPRIIGGQNAFADKYSYIASLRISNIHFCGGSILNKRWILTAAHCIKAHENVIDNVTVVVGTYRLDDGGQEYDVARMVPHEHSNDPEFSNDVGVILVTKDIEFNDRVKPINLPKEDFDKASCYPATLLGWGMLNRRRRKPSNELQIITVRVIRHLTCQKKYSWEMNINEGHLCTYNKFGEGICSGDSGGPLVADGVQIGIVSFGSLPCAFGSPDVYARVYTYLHWIQDKTESTF